MIVPVLLAAAAAALLYNALRRDDTVTDGTVILEPGELYEVTVKAVTPDALQVATTALAAAGASRFKLTGTTATFQLRVQDSLEVDIPMPLPGADGITIMGVRQIEE